MNIFFLALILTLFAIELTSEAIPTFVSLEISVFLVSVKIVCTIHSQHKFNHFEFWVFNSIEFRMRQIDTMVRKIEKGLREPEPEQSGP